MAIVKCEHCLGQKTIMGLGMMYYDCPDCDGIGYIKQSEAIKETDVVKAFKPRGRPKKYVE